ncbi:hypothetical protein SAMN05443547_0222 [Flavobacterium cucumis]|uniref:Uncharacterized protein n=1 Tax=Flavobacterium cucumis TaxID=416016 RepID=A0A1M7ZSW5_9FLAO|nr:hypothetical protein SAMN05443547_0222 [Flavobacterium cucumis]
MLNKILNLAQIRMKTSQILHLFFLFIVVVPLEIAAINLEKKT